jgi:hypothetical protein
MSMHPPPDPDELASDLVDGLLDDEVAARLRSDPAIAARVEAIEAARAALRVPPPSAPGAVERALAATFAALDRGAGDPGVAPDERPPPPVTHLRTVGAPSGGAPTAGGLRAPVPAHRARRGSSGMPWLAAAAAIVLLGLVTIGILSSSGSDEDQASDTAASAEIDDDASSGAAETGDDAGAGEGDGGDERAEQDAGAGREPAADQANPPATTLSDAPADRGDLGAVGSAAELADRIRAQDRSLPSSPDDETGSTDPEAALDEETAGSSACPGRTTDGDPAHGESRYVADAVLDGVRVRVHVYDSGDGTLRLVATDESCVDVVDAPFSD